MMFDILVIAVLLISALHAFWRGLIREVLTIFGALGGLFASLSYGDDLNPVMDTWLGVVEGEKATKLFDVIPMTLVSDVLSYAAIFVLVFGVLTFLSHLIAEQARALGLGAIDRTLGVVFGLARGLLIVAIFYLPIHIVMDDKDKQEWFKESHTHPVVAGVSGWIEGLLPENMLPFKTKVQDDAPAVDPTKAIQSTLDLLKQDPPRPADPPPATGYETDTREKMDQLIDQEKATP
jgi:membrane protein required for colicin V production